MTFNPSLLSRTVALACLFGLPCPCGTGTEPGDPAVHGGPDNRASDGIYTEAISVSDGVASLESLTLGGVDQWVLIRGNDTTNPVLVFLHGGPGSPAIRYARFAFKPLEEHFTVVSWDQRGCGKSFNDAIDPQTLTFDRLFSDAHELVLQMRSRFGTHKVFLMGTSWGAILGVRLTDTYPELFNAYIAIAQPVNSAQGLGIAIDFAIEQVTSVGDNELVDEFTELQNLWQEGPTLAWEESGLLSGWLESNGYGDLHDISLYTSLAQEAGTLTEYTAQDEANEDAWQTLYDTSPLRADVSWLLDIDFDVEIPRLEAPTTFMTGRWDYKAPLELAVWPYAN